MSAKVPVESWPAKISEVFRADPKKGTFLSVLVVVLAVLWGRMLLGSKTPAAHGFVATAPQRTDNPVTFGAPRSNATGQSPLSAWAASNITPMNRNLFAIPLDYYPTAGAHTAESEKDSGGFWEQLAKSMSMKADQQEQRRILVDNVRTLAATLKLQSTMMGTQPSAMVNGEMVREGSVIAGFRILKIEARRMVVEHETVRLEILMK